MVEYVESEFLCGELTAYRGYRFVTERCDVFCRKSGVLVFYCLKSVLSDIFGTLTERFVTLMPPTVIEDGKLDMYGATLIYDPEKYILSFSKEPRTEDKFAYFTDLTLKEGVKEFTATFIPQ